MKIWMYIVLLSLLAHTGHAQSVKLGTVMDPARHILAAAWNDTDPNQHERAYCINLGQYYYTAYWADTTNTVKDTIIRVLMVEQADVPNDSSDATSITFNCNPGAIELHIHTPTSCYGNDMSQCQIGGLNAYSCQPSRKDLEKLVKRGDPFAVIQCDKWTYRFYYPSELIHDR